MHDVVVIGGGPAGSSAAMRGAELGLLVVLLEKHRLPRWKVCGGGLTRACLEQLPAELPSGLVKRRCHSLTAAYGEHRVRISSAEPLVVQIQRDEFDLFLLEVAMKKGAIVHDGVCAEGIEFETNKVIVRASKGTYECKTVIVADGAAGRISNAFFGRSPSINRTRLGVCRLVHIPISWVDKALSEDEFEVVYGVIPTGYIWVFPKTDYLSVGIGGPWEEMANGLHLLKRWISRRFPSIADRDGQLRFVGGFLPRCQRNPVPAPGIMLAGDAAGFVDPFLGEGIRYALQSGRLAAEEAAAVIQTTKPISQEAYAGYRRNCREAFGKNLEHAETICKIFRHLNKPILEFYFSSPGAFQKSAGILDGSISYKALAKWLLRQMPGSVTAFIKGIHGDFSG